MMHLTFKRLEVSGHLEVRWCGEGLWGEEQSEGGWWGAKRNGIWSIKNKLKIKFKKRTGYSNLHLCI